MGKFNDLSGKKFGRLTALYRINNYHKKRVYWLCVCDCGNLKEVSSSDLTCNNTKSCGCLPKGIIKHGLRYTRLYTIWCKIKNRCYDSSASNYPRYGGRGITICDEWLNDPTAFYTWSIDNGYQDTLSIDRIDNNKGYSPNNCRWTNATQQGRNKRNNKSFTINGETRCLSEWCEIYNLKYATVWNRVYNLHWSIEKSLEISY